MTTSPDAWVYGDFAPHPNSRDLPGLKADWILAQLPRGDALTVLDYGTGEGKHLKLIRQARPRSRLVGVDVRSMHSPADFEFHKIAADGMVPFDDRYFDVVVSCDVLEHVEDVKRCLNEVLRVMRPGASFIGFVPAEGGLGPHGLFRLFDPNIYRDSKDHHQNYTRRQLRGWFQQRFEVVRIAYSYHLLGSSLDAVFFASFKAPLIGRRLEGYWRGQENDTYRSTRTAQRPSLFGRLIRVANRAAYFESRLLRSVPFTAKGLHFHVRKR